MIALFPAVSNTFKMSPQITHLTLLGASALSGITTVLAVYLAVSLCSGLAILCGRESSVQT